MLQPIFAANWKLNKGPQETRDFISEFLPLIPKEKHHQIMLFTPATNLEAALHALKETSIQLGSQNCYSQAQGAFTGEISASVVKAMGAHSVLIGHSERRQIFKESNEFIAQKGKLVQSLDLIPVICIGETLEERESQKTEFVCSTQLNSFMDFIDINKKWVVAYEPVWAIGTGKVATPEQVNETHLQIRKMITNRGGASTIPILYGGSVKPENSHELLKIPEVGGFLIGGASLDPHSFAKICLS